MPTKTYTQLLTIPLKLLISLTATIALIGSAVIPTIDTEAFENFDQYHLRYQANIPGGIVFTGNANGLSLSNEEAEEKDSLTQDSIGVFTSLDTTLQEEGYPAGTTRDWTRNGSNAFLRLPDNSIVEYAMLVWSGTYQWGPDEDPLFSLEQEEILTPVRFTTPTNQIAVTTDPVYQYFYSSNNEAERRKEYSFTADVTDTVRQSGSGLYSLEGIPGILSDEKINGQTPDNTSGWTLAVAYRNYSETIKNLTIFSGTQSSNSNPANITGFSSPTEGEIRGKLFVSAFEGDAGLTGDQLTFGNSQGNLVTLEGPNNPEDNFFNAQINDINGEIDMSGSFGEYNTDNYNNDELVRQGWDITAVDVSELLQNSQTEAYIQGTSTGDKYIINALGLQIEVNAPVIDTILAVDKPLTVLGDVLTYTVTIENSGSTTAQDVISSVTIPEGTSFIPNTIASSDQFSGNNPEEGLNFGDLEVGESIEYSYQVRVDAIPASQQFVEQAKTDFSYQMTEDSEVINEDDFSNIVVTQVLDEPIVAEDDIITAPQVFPIVIEIIENDAIPVGIQPTVTIISQPSNGNASIQGTTIEYLPVSGFVGVDSFEYEVCIGTVCDSATVTITVPNPNTGQVLGASDKSVAENNSTNSGTPALVRSGGWIAIATGFSLLIVLLVGCGVTIIAMIEPEKNNVNEDSQY